MPSGPNSSVRSRWFYTPWRSSGKIANGSQCTARNALHGCDLPMTVGFVSLLDRSKSEQRGCRSVSNCVLFIGHILLNCAPIGLLACPKSFKCFCLHDPAFVACRIGQCFGRGRVRIPGQHLGGGCTNWRGRVVLGDGFDGSPSDAGKRNETDTFLKAECCHLFGIV